MPPRGRGGAVTRYSRGYSAQIREAVERIPVPREIRCCICNNTRPQSFYSDAQLNFLRQAIFKRGYGKMHKQLVAKCLPCTNAQACEDKCFLCGHYLGIDQFAGSQRPQENPICEPCMKHQLSLESNDQRLALTDKAEGAEDEAEENGPISGSGSGCAKQIEWHSLNESDQSFDKALVLYDDSVEKDGENRVGGFARVKNHRPRPAPTPDSEPAPGRAPIPRKMNDAGPLKLFL
ncbi:hypothetical protein N7535_002132 [Penicillium sp. DV-2018c]|nr:hypothetical protein N7461_004622 [Penicillium sp. DV-2018c]KAJ5583512.1 hypothetical protein N7535_002132 [Penicillium sp. DV-2018c]